MNKINLYPEMNEKIADILRVGGEQPLLYAAALIEKLLHEKQERENPQPLTLEEFISIKNTPIYITPENVWYLKTNDGLIDQYGEASEMEEWNFETYGQFWLAYLTKPTADES